MPVTNKDESLVARLRLRGIRLVGGGSESLVAECDACRTRWEIAGSRLGEPHEDEAGDWWWCPNGCNRSE